MSKVVFLKMEQVLINILLYLCFFYMDKYKLYNLYDDLIYYTHNILKKYPQEEKASLVLDI